MMQSEANCRFKVRLNSFHFRFIKDGLASWSKNNHSMDVEITPYQLSRIKKLYAEPNTWAQSEFELNMKSNGYFLAPSHGLRR